MLVLGRSAGMMEGLNNCCRLLLLIFNAIIFHPFTLVDNAPATHEMYTGRSGICTTTQRYGEISPPLPQFLHGVKKCEFWQFLASSLNDT